MKLSTNELSQKAYTQVKRMILTGKLVPGKKIVQDSLAEELGISRTPLRSALQMLEAEFLVESVPRRGMIVKAFTQEEVLEIYDCRIALEGMAIRSFTEKATEKAIEKLAQLFESFEGLQEIDELVYKEKDTVFHNTIVQKCGNKFLARLFQRGNLLYCIELIGLVRPPQETLPEHMDIIAALRSRDIDRAEQSVRIHLEKSKQLILQNLVNA